MAEALRIYNKSKYESPQNMGNRAAPVVISTSKLPLSFYKTIIDHNKYSKSIFRPDKKTTNQLHLLSSIIISGASLEISTMYHKNARDLVS